MKIIALSLFALSLGMLNGVTDINDQLSIAQSLVVNIHENQNCDARHQEKEIAKTVSKEIIRDFETTKSAILKKMNTVYSNRLMSHDETRSEISRLIKKLILKVSAYFSLKEHQEQIEIIWAGMYKLAMKAFEKCYQSYLTGSWKASPNK